MDTSGIDLMSAETNDLSSSVSTYICLMPISLSQSAALLNMKCGKCEICQGLSASGAVVVVAVVGDNLNDIKPDTTNLSHFLHLSA